MKTTTLSLEPKLDLATYDFSSGPAGSSVPLPKKATRPLSIRTQAILAALDAIHAGREAGLAEPIDSVAAQWPHDSMRVQAKVVTMLTVGMAWPILFDMPRPTGFGLLSGFFLLAFSLVWGYRVVSEEQPRTEQARAKYQAARDQARWVKMCRNMVRKVVFPHDRIMETPADVIACVPELQRLLAKREAQGVIPFPQQHATANVA